MATEAGILHEMIKQVPEKTLIPAPIEEDNSCACSECAYMKLNTMKKLYTCMKYELPDIEVADDMAAKSIIADRKNVGIIEVEIMQADYLIIGSGIAGLTYALRVAYHNKDHCVCCGNKRK